MTKSGEVSQPKSASNDIGGDLTIGSRGPDGIYGHRIDRKVQIDLLSDGCIKSIQTRQVFLKKKTLVEVVAHLQELHALMSTQTGTPIKFFRSDSGKKFEN